MSFSVKSTKETDGNCILFVSTILSPNQASPQIQQIESTLISISLRTT